MKKIITIIIFAILLAAGIAGTFWGSDIAQASSGLWNSCPKGKVNDYYPGDCHDYIDTNRDNICDRSQPAPVPATTKSQPATAAVITPAVTSTSTPTLASAGTAITTTTTTAAVIADTAADNSGGTDARNGDGTGGGSGSNNSSSYYFIPIAATCIALYGISWLLSAMKKFKVLTHRKIWNVVLGITMLGSTILGLVRILIKDYAMTINLPFNALFWHVEISIVLGVIGLFHIIWHWRYFAKMLGMGNKQDAAS
jgi:hypothetical protein